MKGPKVFGEMADLLRTIGKLMVVQASLLNCLLAEAAPGKSDELCEASAKRVKEFAEDLR